nr:cell wall integrity and stress response component 1-like [Procambarus clarkii]
MKKNRLKLKRKDRLQLTILSEAKLNAIIEGDTRLCKFVTIKNLLLRLYDRELRSKLKREKRKARLRASRFKLNLNEIPLLTVTSAEDISLPVPITPMSTDDNHIAGGSEFNCANGKVLTTEGNNGMTVKEGDAQECLVDGSTVLKEPLGVLMDSAIGARQSNDAELSSSTSDTLSSSTSDTLSSSTSDTLSSSTSDTLSSSTNDSSSSSTSDTLSSSTNDSSSSDSYSDSSSSSSDSSCSSSDSSDSTDEHSSSSSDAELSNDEKHEKAESKSVN